MKIVFFSHPNFLVSQSMPRYATMLAQGMQERGHKVEVWSPKPFFFKLPFPKKAKKWLGYIDQYIVFRITVKFRLLSGFSNTLFVFTDHALGPWVSLVSKCPHVIHCHDFLAQRSALNQIPFHKTGSSGKLYQSYIKRGYTKGRNFISVSEKTKEDLHRILPFAPKRSIVIYNGLNEIFKPADPNLIRSDLSISTGINLKDGYILHVGGNQWYKNRKGVIELYVTWRKLNTSALPLIMIGSPPTKDLLELQNSSEYMKDIHFLTNANDDIVRKFYVGASVFLFPSLAEGFGWPIAEAMASGCIVITTNERPMTEVAGDCAFLIPPRPSGGVKVESWAIKGAEVINEVIMLSGRVRDNYVENGVSNAKRFNRNTTLDKIESIYKEIMSNNSI